MSLSKKARPRSAKSKARSAKKGVTLIANKKQKVIIKNFKKQAKQAEQMQRLLVAKERPPYLKWVVFAGIGAVVLVVIVAFVFGSVQPQTLNAVADSKPVVKTQAPEPEPPREQPRSVNLDSNSSLGAGLLNSFISIISIVMVFTLVLFMFVISMRSLGGRF